MYNSPISAAMFCANTYLLRSDCLGQQRIYLPSDRAQWTDCMLGFGLSALPLSRCQCGIGYSRDALVNGCGHQPICCKVYLITPSSEHIDRVTIFVAQRALSGLKGKLFVSSCRGRRSPMSHFNIRLSPQP
jgi:hypothetical protein